MEVERPGASLAHPISTRPAVEQGEGFVETVLLVRTRSSLCALPIAAVVETMRPLPVRSAPGAPRFVRGLAVVRGAPLPVIDLDALLGASGTSASGRFVTLRTGSRQVVLAVDGVVGVRVLRLSDFAAIPPLLAGALPEQVERLGMLDGQTLAVLSTARLLVDDEQADTLNQGASA